MNYDTYTLPVTLLCLAAFVFGLALYFLPWILAKHRDMEGTGFLFLVNLLVGWSLIGWLVCLLWAALGQRRGHAGTCTEPSSRLEPRTSAMPQSWGA